MWGDIIPEAKRLRFEIRDFRFEIRDLGFEIRVQRGDGKNFARSSAIRDLRLKIHARARKIFFMRNDAEEKAGDAL